MRKAIGILIGLLMFAAAAQAQVPAGNVFFGYSFYSTSLSSIDRANTNGWELALEGKVFPLLGIVADFDGHYGSQNFPVLVCPPGLPPCRVGSINANVTEHNYLFGPRVSVSVARFRPFVQALIGAGHVNAAHFNSDTSFATDVGAGVDYKLIAILAWRLQGGYVHTSFFNRGQNNVRISTGIVARF